MVDQRLYLQRNPWITFRFRVTLDPLWALLGEAYSKTQHLAGIPLQPGLASRLGSVYLRRGALATTAIEGNTLTEEDLDQIVDLGRKLPRSQEYLEQEVRNVLEALSTIDRSHELAEFRVSSGWLREQNATILKGLDLPEHVVAGEFTETQTGVGSYRSAPPEDVEYLMERLSEWLNTDYLQHIHDSDTPPDQRFFLAFLGATLGHLYVAWIHPFGDGNGRTARLLQVAILAKCGVVPWVCTNLLSDFYNRTRSRYYAKLEAASKGGDVEGFVKYSAEGFVDMLREQISDVQAIQRRVAWVNYVHEAMHSEASGKTKERRRDLVLAMPEKPLSRRDLARLTTDLAIAYRDTDRMISRDLHRLRELGLVRQERRGYWAANIQLMDAFRC